MQTSKLISSISYNTEKFLRGKLYSLVRSNILEYGYAVWHEPEDDETKGHFHFIVQPNRRLDTNKLRNEFLEVVAGEEKPRCCLPFHSSKMRDWILYAEHNAAYLIQKGETRKHSYKKENFFATDSDQFFEDWRECHNGEDNKLKTIIELAERGVDWKEVVKLGIIPINQLFQYREIFFLNFSQTERGGRDGHE